MFSTQREIIDVDDGEQRKTARPASAIAEANWHHRHNHRVPGGAGALVLDRQALRVVHPRRPGANPIWVHRSGSLLALSAPYRPLESAQPAAGGLRVNRRSA